MSAETATATEHAPSEVELHYPVAHHFDDQEQQHEAAVLGMWTFLGTEVLFFGGLFLAYAIYRARSPVQVALASHHLDIWMGGLNTAVLLVSSLFIALAVREAQLGRAKQVIYLILGTIILGVVFLVVKGFEWTHDWHLHLVPFFGNFVLPPHDAERMIDLLPGGSGPEVTGQFRMFFVLYFFMTGLHAVHLIIGLVIWGVIAYHTWRDRESGAYVNKVEVSGLYWHFIDIVWVFLYPLLYLVDPHIR